MAARQQNDEKRKEKYMTRLKVLRLSSVCVLWQLLPESSVWKDKKDSTGHNLLGIKYGKSPVKKRGGKKATLIKILHTHHEMPSNTASDQPFLVEVLDGVCIGQNIKTFASTMKFHCFRPQKLLKYHAFRDDFGPLNFSCVSRFIELLNDEKANHPECKIVYLVDAGSRELTNAAFLLGAYMLLQLSIKSECVM